MQSGPNVFEPQRQLQTRKSSVSCVFFFVFQAEDGIRGLVRSRGLGDVYKRQHFSESAGSEIKEKIMKSLNDKTFISLALMSLGFLLSLIHI